MGQLKNPARICFLEEHRKRQSESESQDETGGTTSQEEDMSPKEKRPRMTRAELAGIKKFADEKLPPTEEKGSCDYMCLSFTLQEFGAYDSYIDVKQLFNFSFL